MTDGAIRAIRPDAGRSRHGTSDIKRIERTLFRREPQRMLYRYTAAAALGTEVKILLRSGDEIFETQARVVYMCPGLGMGVNWA